MHAIRIIALTALLVLGLLPAAPTAAMAMDHGSCAACAGGTGAAHPAAASCDHAQACCPAALPLPPACARAASRRAVHAVLPAAPAVPSRSAGTDPPPPRT
ncbi:hypothetical protein [Poseidonocella sp. HB161398]|uniref:hypothetical protein n=1 Tax=Poseidonocella sp. HB161398 TaxID=2320855 RepID=UPI001F0D697D|nr:hypothetical protein [Poseidonocella sp. HB161398]